MSNGAAVDATEMKRRVASGLRGAAQRGAVLVAAVLSASMLAGCPKARAPNSTQPYDKVLFDFGNALVVGDRDAALAMYDLDFRQRIEFWDKSLRGSNKPEEQAQRLAAELPRIGEAAALKTVGVEAWKEVKEEPWAQELADGKCTSDGPSKDDIGRGVLPKERKEMPQELGMWVFELRTSVNWAPAFRVHCPSGGTFWVQLAQRKKTDPSKDEPLKLVRVMK